MDDFYYSKLLKVAKWIDRGLIHRTVDNINKDPECGWVFLTTILLLGGFGIGLCLVWFYLMLKQGMPVWAIILDSSVVIFCAWVIIKFIVPKSKECYNIFEEKRKNNKNE